MVSQPPHEEPQVARVLQEEPEQRYVGERDLTHWPTAAGAALARAARRLRERLAPHWVLLVAATAAGSLTLTVVGKSVIGRIRPPLADAVPPYELSASFPSGHSLNSVALAGIVACLLVRRQHGRRARALTVSAAAAFAFTMGASRVYLGHHWLTDVLVAWALGLAWLTVVITAHRLLLTVRRGDRVGP